MELIAVSDCHDSNLQGKPGLSAAQSGAVAAAIAHFDVELAEVIKDWPALSAHDRSAVLAIVRKAAKG